MNATSLYVSTCRIVMNADSSDPSTWSDLYRLIPYLRQSLSCCVCTNLLLEPFTPLNTNCQHHVCRSCKGGKKKFKPSCNLCKDYEHYIENVQLRILLQCYKKLCAYFLQKKDFALSLSNTDASNLIELIQEGAGFTDEFDSQSGLSKTAYSILPCVYANSSTQTQQTTSSIVSRTGIVTNTNSNINRGSFSSCNTVSSSKSVNLLNRSVPSNNTLSCNTNQTVSILTSNRNAVSCNVMGTTKSLSVIGPSKVLYTGPRLSQPIKTVSDGQSLYSVLYAGNGNKLTIKRKAADEIESNFSEIDQIQNTYSHLTTNFKKPSVQRGIASVVGNGGNGGGKNMGGGVKRKGCRCGNATATPGKLTCCGQRCPCYVESKACVECRCRGCRNPHRADGIKVRPHIPALDNLKIHYPDHTETTLIRTSEIKVEMDNDSTGLDNMYHGQNLKVVELYSTDFTPISASLPPALLMDDETSAPVGDHDSPSSIDDSSDVEIDV